MAVQSEGKGTTRLHKPCAFNPVGVDSEGCRNISAVVHKNHGGCQQTKCQSPWRLCAACVLQTGEPKTVERQGADLCAFHREHGRDARAPERDISASSMPRRNRYDDVFEKPVERVNPVSPAPAKKQAPASGPAKIAVPEPKPKAEPKLVAKQVVERPRTEVIARPPVPGRDIIPPRTPTPAAASSEDGRAILERVRIAISNAVYEVVDVRRIRPMPGQPRAYFNQERLRNLADSIKSVGQITPGYLRKVESDAEGRDYELVDGERRWRAVILGDVSTYRAMVVKVDDEAAQYIVSVIANFNREGHTVLEIADAIRTMHEKLKLSMSEIAESIGFTTAYVSNLYGLRRLVPAVRAMLDPEVEDVRRFPVAAAIEISRLPVEHQEPLARRVLRREVNLRTLRSEVVAISKRHGIPVQRKVVEASKQRRAIERKTDLIERQVDDLIGRVEEASAIVLKGWGFEGVDHERARISRIRSRLEALDQTLEQVLRK